jgi:hypothetical protein
VAFEIALRALGKDLRKELTYLEKLAVVMALEQALCVLLQITRRGYCLFQAHARGSCGSAGNDVCIRRVRKK